MSKSRGGVVDRGADGPGGGETLRRTDRPSADRGAGRGLEPAKPSRAAPDAAARRSRLETSVDAAEATRRARVPRDAGVRPRASRRRPRRTRHRRPDDRRRAPRAGVRWAFTVPGESFLGLIDGLEAPGSRSSPRGTRARAAFMAEAHAQLTGRPAACLATRAVGGSNLAIGIHTAWQDSSPMFALVGQVERAFRGREGFQEIDRSRTIGRAGQVGRRARAVPRTSRPPMAQAVREALTGRPGPVLLSLAEDLLDEVGRTRAGPTRERRRPARATDDEIGAVMRAPRRCARRPVILAGGGILRARTSNELLRLAELLRVPVIAAWRRGDVISNDHPLYLGHGRVRRTGVGPRAAGRRADAMLVIGCRLNEAATYGWTIPAAGDALGPRRHRARTARAICRPPICASPRTPIVPASCQRAARGRRRARRGRVATATPRNAADRATWEADTVVDDMRGTGRACIPGGSSATLRGSCPTKPILTTDAGNFAGWAGRGFRFRRPGTFLGPTSGAMGYGLPAAIAAGPRPPRSPGRGAGRRRRAGDDDGRARDRGSRGRPGRRRRLRQRAVRHDPQVSGPARTGEGRRGTELGPVDFAAVARAVGARGARVERDAAFEPALRAGARRGPADGHPARARPALGLGGPAGRLMRPTFHMTPVRDLGPHRDPGGPYEAPSLATEGFIHCTDGEDELLATANRHYLDDPRAFVALTVDLDAAGSPWRIEVPRASTRTSMARSTGPRSWRRCRCSGTRPAASPGSARSVLQSMYSAGVPSDEPRQAPPWKNWPVPQVR